MSGGVYPGNSLPLSGIKVVDFTWHGAGPFTTRVLADFGADVIRLESSKRLDGLRRLGPFRDGIRGVDRSGYFANRNSNKRDMLLNLKHPEARQIALDLISGCDVVANNFSPGVMGQFGLAYEDVIKVRPDVIYLAMSVNGADGPEKDEVGYGLTVSALAGLHHISGRPDMAPMGTGTNYPDHVAAPCHAAFATLAALRHRRRTGQGQSIDLSQAETMTSLLGPAVLDYTVNGVVEGRQGNRVAGAAPNGVYRCAGEDRWIAISVRSQPEWMELVSVLGLGDLVTSDPRFHDLIGRDRSRADLDRIVGEHTRSWDGYDLMAALQQVGIAAGVVQTAADLVDRDEQLRHRNHFVRLDHLEMGPSLYDAQPYRLSRVADGSLRSPAPLLGEHTEQICAELLGMAPAEIARLTDEEVLR